MADKIQVAVRVRPVLFQKKDVEIHWSWAEGVVFQCEPGTQKRIGNPYLFDQVFGTETQNYQIFTKLVQPLIDSAMNGFNVTVLAYGQTASGKTYTMMGSQKELGIVQLAVERIFTLIEQYPERAFLLRCSYIEIYNETISDLLSSNPQKLKVQELAEGHVVVHNLIETNVNTPDAVLKLMQQGNKQRKVGGTSMNERSSRSHTIFRIIVESVPRDEADRSDAAVIVSHINLVDLAGSEKASQTNATGDRFREGCAINTSLSALSLVIKQLSEGEGFVNFRDSKLTHILRASLGGNARTAIICNVTPTVLDETSSTLKFACSAKAVQNQPHVNEVLSDQALLRKYNNYIKDLEKKLKEKELEKKPEAIEEMRRLLQEKDMKINELKEQLVVSSDVVSGRPESSLTSAQRSLRRMTWGGNRLKQELNLLGPTIFEVNTPPVPCSEKVSRTVAQVFASRQRTSNTRRSETLDEVAAELEDLDSEIFLPAEMVFSKDHNPITKVDVATMTDVRESPFKQPVVPSTPVPVLREQLQRMRMSLFNKEQESETLREELEDLKNFTRLEQEIGVHALATAKSVDSPESADKLHQALQTANDMEVLYLDTHRKLSELQTEFRTKEAEHESEIHAMQTDHKLQIETELTEKKRFAKELTDLKDKFERLEKDHSEADTHVQVISERHAKREADLRETLQEAWAQLELLGADPNAIKENYNAKQKLTQVEQELLEMQRFNSDAQSRITSLTEELRQFKESALSIPEASFKDDDERHDSSLTGMCMADELRDVLGNQECSFVARSIHRTRKRPSSILSVALAKMDQSACMLDPTEQEIEPSKKTRLSIQSNQSEELDILEVKEIREYLVELQSVLVRYEADYEVLSQEKELLNSQLLNAQNEIEILHEEKNKVEPVVRRKDEESSVKKLDTSEEMLDSSCLLGEQSISTSMMYMEESCESDDQFLSLRDQMTDTRGSSISTEISNCFSQNLEAAQARIRALEQNEVAVSNQAESFQCTIKDLSDKNSNLNEMVAQFQSDLQSKEAELINLRSVTQEIALLESRLQNVDVETAKMTRIIDDKTDEILRLEGELVRLHERQRELDEIQISLQTMQSVNDDLVAKLSDKENLNVDLRENLENSTQRFELLHSKLELVQSEKSSLAERVLLLESQLECQEQEIGDLRQGLGDLSNERELSSQLKQRLISLQAQYDEMQKFNSDAQSRIASLTEEVRQLKESALSVPKASVKDDDEGLDSSVNRMCMADELRDVFGNQECSFVSRSIHRTRKRPSSILSVVLAKMDQSACMLDPTEQDIEPSKKTRLSIQSDVSEELDILEVKEIREYLVELQSVLVRYEADYEVLSQEKEVLDCRLLNAQTEIESLREEKNKIDTLVRDEDVENSAKKLDTSEEMLDSGVLNQKLEAAQARIRALEQNEVDVSNQMESFQCTIKDLSDKNSNLNEIVAQFQSNIQSMEAELIHLRSMTQEIALLESRLQDVNGETVQMSRIIDEKTDEILRLEEELSRALESQRNYQSQLQHAEQNFQERQRELDEIRISLQSMQSLNDDLVAKLSDQENLNEDLRKNLENSAERFDLLHSKLELVQSEKSSLSESVSLLESQLECQEAKIVNLNEMVAQFQSDLQSKEAELINLRSRTQEIALLESRLQNVDGETAQMSRIIDGKTNEILRLEGELVRLHERQRELDEIRISLQSMQSVNDDLVAKLSDKENLNVDLHKNLENSTQRFELLHSKLELVQSEKSSLSERVLLLESQLECQEAKNVNLNQMVALFQSDIQSKEAELINLRSMTQEIALLESRLRNVDVETAKMSQIIDGKTDEIARLEEELARATESQRNYQTQLQHAEQRFHERQRELDEIRISLQSMQSLNDDLVSKLSEKENLNGDLRKNLENGTQRFELLHSKLELVQSEKSSLAERVRLLESQLECQEQEIGDLRQGLSEVHNERGLSTQLKQRLNSLQAQYDDAVSQCQQLRLVRDEILTHQEQSREEVLRLGSKLQVIAEEKSSLEQYRILSESQKEAILHDYQTVKNALTEKENELHIAQRQRDEFSNQVRMLNDQIAEVRTKANALESSCKFQVQRQLEETVDKLKRELVETRSKNEIIHLNFETEEDHRKKKIERLEKELETVKQQYVKSKEQLRLLRDRPNEDGTVSLPKPRLSIVVESISIQTDPIADKGFGFRWQMEQYVSDNERLRKKVSEIGERMEFYKEKLIKYRNLYFQTTGQDPQRPSSSASNHSSQPMERHSSSSSNSSNCRENVADCPNVDLERNPTRKTLAASAVPASISSQPVALQAAHQEEAKARISTGVAKPAMTASSSTRWSGGKKESLTKEEMEKINNCNPS